MSGLDSNLRAANSDNNLNQSTDLVVKLAANEGPVGGGGLVRITAAKVQ